jgi:hypothetical protein
MSADQKSDEAKFKADWLKVSAELARAVRDMLVEPDITDREQRERWVLSQARRTFRRTGQLMCTVTLRTAGGKPKLIIVAFDLDYELAYLRGPAITAIATFFRAQQLYVAFEMWWAHGTREEMETGYSKVQPRHRPDRKEGLLLTAEDPLYTPPLRAWVAQITRDDKGKGSVGDWQEDFKDFGGRLTYLLPASAYEAAGVKVPEA